MAILLRKLLLRIILEQEIVLEEKAYRFYNSLLTRAVMNDSAELLKKLLAEELIHRFKLEEVQRTGDLFVLITEYYKDFMKGIPRDTGFQTLISGFMFARRIPERRKYRKFPYHAFSAFFGLHRKNEFSFL